MRTSNAELSGLIEREANDFFADAADNLEVDIGLAQMSAAISLKRIADSLESLVIQLQK